MRKKRPLDRALNPVRDVDLIVIASEDEYAVKQYFKVFQSTRIQFIVLPTEEGRGAPKAVLERLDEYREEFDIGDGDVFWLVTDCDHRVGLNHIRNLTDALRQCRQKGIDVALSNPCFDLWLLLHFAEFPTGNSLICGDVGDQLRAAVKSLDSTKGYDKKKVYNLPIAHERVVAAVNRSAENYAAGDVIPTRPQTAVHLILQSLLDRGILTVHPHPDISDPRPKKATRKKK
jgi:hypothetical protein